MAIYSLVGTGNSFVGALCFRADGLVSEAGISLLDRTRAHGWWLQCVLVESSDSHLDWGGSGSSSEYSSCTCIFFDDVHAGRGQSVSGISQNMPPYLTVEWAMRQRSPSAPFRVTKGHTSEHLDPQPICASLP